MTAVGYTLVGFSAASAALAVYAGGNYAVAIPAATAAVVLATVSIAGFWRPAESLGPPRPERRAARAAPVSFGAGYIDRESVLLTLDRLDRLAGHPERSLDGRERERLLRASQAEFIDHVAGRIDALEATP